MEKTKIANFQKDLIKKREELHKGLARTQDENHQGHDFGKDEGDRAIASQSKEMTFRQNAQGRGLLVLIDAALARIKDGTYGECLNCEQEIGLNRLTAVPWSRYCIVCQELIEKQ